MLEAAIIERASVGFTVSLTTAIGTTEAILIGNHSIGTVGIPTGSSVTTLTYWVSQDGVTYIPLYTVDNAAAVTQTVAATRAYPIRSEAFGARFLKIVSNAAGDVSVSLKS